MVGEFSHPLTRQATIEWEGEFVGGVVMLTPWVRWTSCDRQARKACDMPFQVGPIGSSDVA